jgi:Mannosyltransferase (PIG-V)
VTQTNEDVTAAATLRERSEPLSALTLLREARLTPLQPVRAWRLLVRLGEAYWKPLAMLAASRLMTFFVVVVTRYVPNNPVVGGNGLAGHRFARLAAWDGGWYLTAAQHGWPHAVPIEAGWPAYSTLAFFPAFPLAIRAVAFFGFGYLAAGMLTALIFQVAMAVLMWQLAKEIWGEAVADRGTLLFLFGPGAVVFALIYSEPMLLAAAAACMLALRRRWWVAAGLFAALGTAVRPVGIALVACCAWEAVVALRSNRDWRALAAPLLSPIGIIVWFGYLWAHTGDPFIWSKAEKAWDDNFDPLTLVTRFLRTETIRPTGQRLEHVLPVAGFLFCVAALILLIKTKPPAMVVVFSVAVVFISVSSRAVGLRPRLIETAFPLVLVFGYWLKDISFSLALAVAGVGLGSLLFLTLTSTHFIP